MKANSHKKYFEDLNDIDLKNITGGNPWIARGVIVWFITQCIDGVVDGLNRPCE